MESNYIRDFWQKNPCGQHLVSGTTKNIDNFRDFFIRYDKFRYATEGHILSNLDKVDFKNKKVLEIGIGQASDAQQIIERGGLYYGVDFTQEACDRAALRFKIFNKPYRELKRADAANIPFEDNYFDIIYSHGVLHHIPDVKKVSDELYRVLKTNGRLIIMVYAKKSLNYYLSILFVRRLLLVGLFLADKMTARKVIRRGVLKGHLDNVDRHGLLKYLSSRNFLSRNTDGPDNPYSRVYTEENVKEVFSRFEFNSFNQYFLNERQMPFLRVLPMYMKKTTEKRFGWHLWCYGGKI